MEGDGISSWIPLSTPIGRGRVGWVGLASGCRLCCRRRLLLLELLGSSLEDAHQAGGHLVDQADEAARRTDDAADDLAVQRLLVGDVGQRRCVVRVEETTFED